MLDLCLSSLEKLSFDNKEIIVLDGGSSDGSKELVLKKYVSTTLIDLGKNLGYAKANNVGADYAKGKWLIFLNNDAFLDEKWLIEIERVINKYPSVAAIGGKIYKWLTNEFDSAGAFIDYPLGYGPGRGRGTIDNGRWDDYCEVAYLSGAAICVNKHAFLEVGGFDPSYGYLHEETDLCWRLRLQGYKVIYTPTAICWHVGSYSFKKATLNRFYLVELNRMRTNAKNYSTFNLFQWLFNELLYTIFLCVIAPFSEKYTILFFSHSKAVKSFLQILKPIMKTRACVQSARKVLDNIVLKAHRRRTIADISCDALVKRE